MDGSSGTIEDQEMSATMGRFGRASGRLNSGTDPNTGRYPYSMCAIDGNFSPSVTVLGASASCFSFS